MKGLFSLDNPVIRAIVKLGYCWYLNLLWLVTSLPIVTIGASTTALLYSMMKLHGDEGYPTKNYFISFRENFKQATIIWIIYALAGALLAIDLIYWNNVGIGTGNVNFIWAVTIALCILYAVSLCYVFAIQAKFVNPVKKTIAFALLLPFRNLKETALIAVTILGLVYVNLTTIFAVNFMTMTFGIGLVAFLFAVFYTNVFNRYIPERRYE